MPIVIDRIAHCSGTHQLRAGLFCPFRSKNGTFCFKLFKILTPGGWNGYVKSELSQLRLQIIAAYRIWKKLMDVVLIYEGDSAYATTIDQVNAEIRHYKQIIARKGGPSSGGGDNGGGSADE